MFVRFLTLSAVLAVSIICTRTASAQLDRHYTRETIDRHFKHLAETNQPLRFPRLILEDASKVGDIGDLRSTVEGNYAMTLRVVEQLDEGTLIEVNHHQRAHVIANEGNAHYFEAEHTTAGPFLIKSPAAATIQNGGRFIARGLWQISGTFQRKTPTGNLTLLVVEPLSREEIDIPEASAAVLDSPYLRWNAGDVEHFGVYRGLEKGAVLITDVHQQDLKIPLADLPADQQEWVRKRFLSDRRKR